MLKLYAFHWYCGRAGDLDGLFVADEKEIEAIIGKEICFGEVLGKHSEIIGVLDRRDFTVKSEDQDFINKAVEIIGPDLSGYNPLNYIENEEDE